MANGIRRIVLRVGPTGKAKISFKAKGARLPLPTRPDPNHLVSQDPTVTVQLVNNEGQCWEGVYQRPAKRSDHDVFKDK